MTNQTNSTENQDINLNDVSVKIRKYLSKTNDSVFDGILFIKRNIIYVIVLIVLGAGLGIYKDETSRQYEQKIFIIPNFGSTDYVYEEIENLRFKMINYDAEFMKASGMKSPEKVEKIEIEPVIEIYEFIEDKDVDEDDRKFQLFKLISENGDMKKMLEDKTTSRNYKQHLLTITTNAEVSRADVIDPILKYFNTRPYFLKMKQEYINNLNLKIAANDTVIKQIDGVLNEYASRKNSGTAMYYLDNTELDKVIKLKNKLTIEQGQNRIDKVNYENVLAESGMLLNSPKKNILAGRMKYVVPFLFLFLFFIVVKFRNYYTKQVNKRRTAGV